MSSPSRRCQPEQESDDKSVMKVTLVSCKGAHPSQSVVNVHIDGINPNVNTPQINKFMRRLTKNVVKIQNEIENQKNPRRKKTDSANDTPTGSGSQDSESTEHEGRIYPTTTNACEREAKALPACGHQQKDLSTKEETSSKVKSNVPVKSTNATTDIVEIYSNKLINQSYDSVFIDEWMKHDSSVAKPVTTQPLCRRKKSLSCTNIATNAIHVFPVNLPGNSRQKEDDEVDQEDNDTDDISLRTGSVENDSLCSCRVSAGDIIVQADYMELGSSSNVTLVLSGKSSNRSAFNGRGASNKNQGSTTTTTTSTEMKGGPNGTNDSADELATVTDTSQGFNSEDGRSTTGSGNSDLSRGSEGKKVSSTESGISEKHRVLLSEEAANEELRKKTEEQNKRISELNKKLDELSKKNAELNRARAEEMRKREEERWRVENERQRKIEGEEAENAKRLECSYPGIGRNRIVRTITKGNRTNIEAIDAIFCNKLSKPMVRKQSPVASSRWDGYSSSSRRQPPNSSAERGLRSNEGRLPPPDNFDTRGNRGQSMSPGYSIFDPSLDFSDRSRGPDNSGNQSERQGYDPSLDFSDRSRGPANSENQPGRQGYDRNHEFPRERSQGTGNMNSSPGPRQTPIAPIPAKECEICTSSSDQDVTFCCCFKKKSKQNEKSRSAAPQKSCLCCGQCPPHCICEKGDLAPVSLYQNTASVPTIPEKVGDGIFPSRELKPNDKPLPDGWDAAVNATAANGDTQLESGDSSKQQTLTNSEAVIPNISGEILDTNKSLENIGTAISTADLHKANSKNSILPILSDKSDGQESELNKSLENIGTAVSTADLHKANGKNSTLPILSDKSDGQGSELTPSKEVQNNVNPQADNDKKEQFIKERLGCNPNFLARADSGINPSQEFRSKDNVSHDGGVETIKPAAAASSNGDKRSGGSKPRKQGTILKYFCSCCYCQDSQQSLANSVGVVDKTSGQCLVTSKSLQHVVKGISSAGLDKTKSSASSVGDRTALQMLSCQCNGQEEGQTPLGVVQNNVDQQTDKEKKAQLVQKRLGCDCDGSNDMQTVQEKFADESRKEQFMQQRMSCACDEPKIEDFPSEEFMGFENYEEQYFNDAMGIDCSTNVGHHTGHRGGNHADVGHAGSGVPHYYGCDGDYQPKDLDGKRNLVERCLDRHGFGNRHDCDKKRMLVQTRMSCVCDAEEKSETLRKQRILEGRLDCQCRTVGNPKKMREFVRSGLGCGAQCDEHAARETRRKQAIVERSLGCSANHLRDTGKKSAYLKRRLDCICDDAGTQAKKQQAYLERFLTCGCTDVVKDIQKKKQFVDDFLKCKCDKESEVKKMQMYLERVLTCDCEHIKDRNMDKKIDYMNKVMSCDGPSCQVDKDGKKLVTVCGGSKVSVAAVTKRLPASSRALGSDALLCCCGSGESFLGPCRCDSMTEVEKSSSRRHRRGVPTVAGGLICRCGKEGDSECVCDGVKSPAKSSSTPQGGPRAKCKCRHRLDGICRCRDKTGKNANLNVSRSYMINQVPCDRATKVTAKSVSDSILCSAKQGDCNCELDPESCFCPEKSKGKPTKKLKESDTSETNSPEADEETSASEENQDEVERFGKKTKESPVEESVDEVEDWCVCKKSCSGRCKCDIDGSDCRHGHQARRCYCDTEEPETCICAKAATPRHRASPQGTCYCNKDAEGRCKCDNAEGKGQHRLRDRSEATGACDCTKDASGQCKCDKVGNKGSNAQSIANSGVLIELKNVNSKSEVTISDLDAREGNLKVNPGSSNDIEKVPAAQESFHEHETQLHFVESNQNDLFVLKEPCVEENSSESCLESTDETSSINELEYSPSHSESGNTFVYSPSQSVIGNMSASGNTFVYSSIQSASNARNVCVNFPSQSASDNEYVTPPNETASREFIKTGSTEIPNVHQDQVCFSPTVSSMPPQDTQSGASSGELNSMHVEPAEVAMQSVQVGTSSTKTQSKRLRDAAKEGRRTALGEGRRPKWYHMFHLPNGKGRKRSKIGSQDDSGTSADTDDWS